MRSLGYTLIEMMMVISMLMLVVHCALVIMSPDDRGIARCQLHKIYTLCTYLQMRARAINQAQCLIFDSVHNSYSYNGITEMLPSGVIFGVLDGTKGPPSCPTHLVTNPITSENQCITFTPHGIIQPGTIYIKTTQYGHMYALSASVAQASFLRMYAYNNGRWTLLL